MEDPYSSFCNSFYYIDEGIEECLKQSLLYTTLELENTILSAREELARKDEELMHLKNLLTNTAKERDETIAKCQEFILENMFQKESFGDETSLFSSGLCSSEFILENLLQNDGFEHETPLFTSGLSSSDSEENAVSVTQFEQKRHSQFSQLVEKIEPVKALPEKGRFLEAVMGAGPLLQTLLLAGPPLPQWQRPPPDLSSIDIPPVTLSSPRTSPVMALPSKVFASTSKRVIF